jgi:hypothetical protein
MQIGLVVSFLAGMQTLENKQKQVLFHPPKPKQECFEPCQVLSFGCG